MRLGRPGRPPPGSGEQSRASVRLSARPAAVTKRRSADVPEMSEPSAKLIFRPRRYSCSRPMAGGERRSPRRAVGESPGPRVLPPPFLGS